jgi:hypothetical protein
MDAKEISSKLESAKTVADHNRLSRGVGSRRTVILERLREIVPEGSLVPPTRSQAIASGPDAVRNLDDEAVSLRVELDYLDDLEGLIMEAADRAAVEQLRRDLPKSRKNLPVAIDTVRKAITELDTAIEALNVHVEVLAQYGRLDGQAFPLSDAGLADLICLREVVWRQRNVLALIPPADFGESNELFYERVGDPSSGQRIRRRQPGLWLPDLRPEAT